MRLDFSHTYKAKNIKLVAESLEEPNYGNLFWKYSFYIDDILVKNEKLNTKNEGLVSNLKNFQFNSKDENFIFIPKYTSVLYDIEKNTTFEIKLPNNFNYKSFVKNIFFNNKLLIVYTAGYLVINLKNYNIDYIDYKTNSKFINDIQLINDSKFQINYDDLNDKKIKEEIVTI